MKTMLRTLIPVLIIASLLAACTMGAAPESETASQDAVNTAVAGTQQASALAQATVNANALTAMPATPTPGPTIEYVTLTEEELAALIDEAVAEAIAATEQTTTNVYYVTEDDAVTTEEVAYVYEYYYYADYYVEYAEDLIEEYYALYSDLAYEMISELNAIEAELNQMNDTLSSIDQSLQQISSTLEQGLARGRDHHPVGDCCAKCTDQRAGIEDERSRYDFGIASRPAGTFGPDRADPAEQHPHG